MPYSKSSRLLLVLLFLLAKTVQRTNYNGTIVQEVSIIRKQLALKRVPDAKVVSCR